MKHLAFRNFTILLLIIVILCVCVNAGDKKEKKKKQKGPSSSDTTTTTGTSKTKKTSKKGKSGKDQKAPKAPPQIPPDALKDFPKDLSAVDIDTLLVQSAKLDKHKFRNEVREIAVKPKGNIKDVVILCRLRRGTFQDVSITSFHLSEFKFSNNVDIQAIPINPYNVITFECYTETKSRNLMRPKSILKVPSFYLVLTQEIYMNEDDELKEFLHLQTYLPGGERVIFNGLQGAKYEFIKEFFFEKDESIAKVPLLDTLTIIKPGM